MTSQASVQVIGLFGLGHSGSTVIERCLASHDQCLGLGEVNNTLCQMRSKGVASFSVCTCGENAEACPVWKHMEEAGSYMPSDVVRLLRRATDCCGRPVVVDTSKSMAQYRRYSRLESCGRVDLTAIMLIRDFRAWSLSRSFAGKQRGLGILQYIVRSWYWMYRNIRIRREIRTDRGRCPVVWYEDFVQEPDSVCAGIWKRIGLPERPVEPGDCCQHALKGNGMRFDPQRNSRVIADDAWRDDWRTRWLLPFVMGPWVYMCWLRKKGEASALSP